MPRVVPHCVFKVYAWQDLETGGKAVVGIMEAVLVDGLADTWQKGGSAPAFFRQIGETSCDAYMRNGVGQGICIKMEALTGENASAVLERLVEDSIAAQLLLEATPVLACTGTGMNQQLSYAGGFPLHGRGRCIVWG